MEMQNQVKKKEGQEALNSLVTTCGDAETVYFQTGQIQCFRLFNVTDETKLMNELNDWFPDKISNNE